MYTGKTFQAPMPKLKGKRKACGAHYRTTKVCRNPDCDKVHRSIKDISPGEQKTWVKHVAETPNLEFTAKAQQELMSYLDVNQDAEE